MLKNFFEILKHLRFKARFYRAVFALILLFVLSFLFPSLYDFSSILFFILFITTVLDAWLLFRNKEPVTSQRKPKYQRLSNGDINEIELLVISFYSFRIKLDIVDELPVQFQQRDFMIRTTLESGSQKKFSYQLRPLTRGEYHFGFTNLFISSDIGLIERQVKSSGPEMIACYPSFIQLKQFELLAISNRLSDSGLKKIRKVGHSTEFEQIKEYVLGDDVRKINWKATARRNQLMLNHYRDERAQQVYCIVDMGRVMKMPFEGMSLLDYAINSSLVIGHVAWIKQDKPGLIGFAEKPLVMVAADRKGNQLLRLQETLYNARTNFEESNYENLLIHVRSKITQRSLIMLYTNFETLSGLKRQLKYLRKLASEHLLVVVFFENTELKQLLDKKPRDTFGIYEQTIARKFDYEKRQITKELAHYGILSVYTSPELLSISTLNKYLEIKTRGLI